MKKKLLSTVISKGAGLTDRQIRVRASEEAQDKIGDILEAGGCDLTDFRNNPVVLFNHDPDHPIGRASLSRSGYAIEEVVEFAPEGASRKADEVCALAKSGVLSGVSVGFTPLESEPIKGGGWRFKRWRLEELSIVAIPCSASATILERSYRSASRRSYSRPLTAHERAAQIRELGAIGKRYEDERLTSLQSSPAALGMELKRMEIERVLDMSRRLFGSDPHARREEREREFDCFATVNRPVAGMALAFERGDGARLFLRWRPRLLYGKDRCGPWTKR